MAGKKVKQDDPRAKVMEKELGRSIAKIHKEIDGKPIPWKYLYDSEKRSALLNPKDTYFSDQINYRLGKIDKAIDNSSVVKRAKSAAKKVHKKITDDIFFDLNQDNKKSKGGKLSNKKSSASVSRKFKCGGKLKKKK